MQAPGVEERLAFDHHDVRAVLGHPALASVPKVLETEKGPAPDGAPWDRVNADRLVQLATAAAGAVRASK